MTAGNNTAQNSSFEEENREDLERLLFILENRDKSTFIVVTFDGFDVKNWLYDKIKESVPHYRFYDLDLSSLNVVSLFLAYRQNLPEEVWKSAPAEYIVNIFGLENSLFVSREGKIEKSDMIPELNFERDKLFRDVPFVTILWADDYIVDKLRREAGDFWDWITYFFHFTGTREEDFVPTEPEALPPIIKGHQPEREERIGILLEKYEKLKLDSTGRERVDRERLTIQKLLGREYLELYDFDNAVTAFKTAFGIAHQLEEKAEKEDIFFLLGDAYLGARNFEEAVTSYFSSLELQKERESDLTIGNTYHQVGRVYQEQRKWSEALVNYQKALQWNKKTKNYYELGSTYHQIGFVYQQQKKWSEALENYQKALQWKNEAKNFYQLGSTYHQIGRVYEEQRKWSEALENYQKALQWKNETKNFYQLGATYHQIGMVYEEQEELPHAFAHYLKAFSHNRNYEMHGEREIILSSIKRILPGLPPEEAKNIFNEIFSEMEEKERNSCYKIIWEE
ncbi:MAG: tetratricopeptide repeat protein [bacterium]|nr:tetratricopeptide repeat protein [bacterium]